MAQLTRTERTDTDHPTHPEVRPYWYGRFRGIDLPAGLAGMLAALGLTVLLAGIASAAGSIGYYERGASEDDLSVAGLVTGFAVLLVSFLAGGWVAGRMARYDGPVNGLLTGLLYLALAAGLAAAGLVADQRYDFLDEVRLPQFFGDLDGTMALVTALVAVAVICLAAMLGGGLGERFHRRADQALADTLYLDGRSDARVDLTDPTPPARPSEPSDDPDRTTTVSG